MACKDCFRNCPQKITDLCVEYTGDDIPELGICNGDTLAFVEANIIEKLLSALNGTGITIEDFVNCSTISTLLDGEDPNAANLLQALVTNACTVEAAIEEINDRLNVPITVNAPCLTLPAEPTRDDILKAVAVKVCEVSTKVDDVFTDYVKSSELCDKVQECLEAVNNGETDTIVQEYTKMPKYVPQLYIGPLTVFDSSGKGLVAQGYDKVYIMNGLNGMQDWRGRVGIGANTGVVGGTLDVAVDPSQTQNAGYSLTTNSKKGTYTEALTAAQTGPHIHGATATDHSHVTVGVGSDAALTSTSAIQQSHSSGGNLGYGLNGTSVNPSVGKTSVASTTITVATAGGGQPHNNLPPSAVGVWIIFIP